MLATPSGPGAPASRGPTARASPEAARPLQKQVTAGLRARLGPAAQHPRPRDPRKARTTPWGPRSRTPHGRACSCFPGGPTCSREEVVATPTCPACGPQHPPLPVAGVRKPAWLSLRFSKGTTLMFRGEEPSEEGQGARGSHGGPPAPGEPVTRLGPSLNPRGPTVPDAQGRERSRVLSWLQGARAFLSPRGPTRPGTCAETSRALAARPPKAGRLPRPLCSQHFTDTFSWK